MACTPHFRLIHRCGPSRDIYAFRFFKMHRFLSFTLRNSRIINTRTFEHAYHSVRSCVISFLKLLYGLFRVITFDNHFVFDIYKDT